MQRDQMHISLQRTATGDFYCRPKYKKM